MYKIEQLLRLLLGIPRTGETISKLPATCNSNHLFAMAEVWDMCGKARARPVL
jgi:hypothetical protein